MDLNTIKSCILTALKANYIYASYYDSMRIRKDEKHVQYNNVIDMYGHGFLTISEMASGYVRLEKREANGMYVCHEDFVNSLEGLYGMLLWVGMSYEYKED